jgi:putative ABC transport system permease protein
MRWQDVLWLAVSGLWQRRLRSALTIVGVAVGCFVLAASLSVGQGVQEAIEAQLRRQDRLRRIVAWPGKGPEAKRPEFEVPGDMSEERRERLREALKLRWRAPEINRDRGIPPEQEAELAKLPHVVEIRPALSWDGMASLVGGKGSKAVEGTFLVGSGTDAGLAPRLLAGKGLEEEGALVSEYLVYRWGIKDEAGVAGVLGKTVRLRIEVTGPGFNAMLMLLGVARPNLDKKQKAVLDRVLKKLPEALARIDLSEEEQMVLKQLLTEARPGGLKPIIVDLPIRGVFRDTNKGELGPWDAGVRVVDVYLPPASARKLYFARPGRANRDMPQVAVLVDSEDALRGVQENIKEMGLETFSLAELVDQVRFNVRLVVIACTLLAAIALAVAALGIVNTMLMAVLQRTHEIGVLKALGARDGHVLAMFLCEGLVIGAAGGVLGMVFAWLASYPGDAFARWLVAVQTPMRLEASVFAYPWWLVLGVPAGVCVVTVLAAAYPASRAASINPIEALRDR